MAKSLKDVLKGVKTSSKVKNDLGGYKPKAGDEADFADKHEIEKHADRVGNGDDVYQATNIKQALADAKEKRHGYRKPQDAKVNESKKSEDVKCNNTAAKTWCPMHEMADCSSSGTLREKGVNEAWTVTHKDGKTTEHDSARDALKASRTSPGSKVGATHGAMGKKAADVLGSDRSANIGSFGPWGYRPPEKKKKVKEEVANEAYDDNSRKVSDWSDKKLNWHASDDRKHSSSHVPAWSELRRRAKTGQNVKPKVAKEEVEELDELSKKTLSSYIKKSSHSAANHRAVAVKNETGRTQSDLALKHHRVTYNRLNGINTAANKLAKEEVEIEESSAGHHHFEVEYVKRKYSGDPNTERKTHTYKVPKEFHGQTSGNIMKRIKGHPESAAAHQKHKDSGFDVSDKPIKFKSTNEETRIDEISTKLALSYAKKAGESQDKLNPSTDSGHRKFWNRQKGHATALDKTNPEHKRLKAKVGTSDANAKDAAYKKSISEVLTKSTTAGETIADFVHSKNPKFDGKSKEKRKQMALAAYYAKQRNEEVENLEESHVEYHLRNVNKDEKSHKKVVEAIGAHKGKFVGASNRGAIVSIHKNKVYDFLKDMKMHGINPDPMERFNEDLAVPLLGGTGKSDEGVEMVKAELKALANKAMHLVTQMPESMHVEPWCQAKIAQAKSMVSDVHDYMIYGDHKEEDEQVDTPMDITTASNPSNSLPNMSVDVGRNV